MSDTNEPNTLVTINDFNNVTTISNGTSFTIDTNTYNPVTLNIPSGSNSGSGGQIVYSDNSGSLNWGNTSFNYQPQSKDLEWSFYSMGQCSGHSHEWKIKIVDNKRIVMIRNGIEMLNIALPFADCKEHTEMFSEEEASQEELLTILENHKPVEESKSTPSVADLFEKHKEKIVEVLEHVEYKDNPTPAIEGELPNE